MKERPLHATVIGTPTTVTSGKTIYHSSDTCPYTGPKERLKQGRTDLAILPINERDPALLGVLRIININYNFNGIILGIHQYFKTLLKFKKIQAVCDKFL
jgi:L-ascorbate metabolism protein UlaG (beta-lactamase superfamily)